MSDEMKKQLVMKSRVVDEPRELSTYFDAIENPPNGIYLADSLFFKKNLMRDFICNYLSYCNDTDLKEIEEQINKTGEIEISLKRHAQPNYYGYKQDFVLSIIKGTGLESNKNLIKFLESEELRTQILEPDTLLTDAAKEYKNFMDVMNLIISKFGYFGKYFDPMFTLDIRNEDTFKKPLRTLIECMDKYLIAISIHDFVKNGTAKISALDLKNFSGIDCIIFREGDDILVSYIDAKDKMPVEILVNDDLSNDLKRVCRLFENDKSKILMKKFEWYGNFLKTISCIVGFCDSQYNKIDFCPACTKRKSKMNEQNHDTKLCYRCAELQKHIVKILQNSKRKTAPKSVLASLKKRKAKYCNEYIASEKMSDKNREILNELTRKAFY